MVGSTDAFLFVFQLASTGHDRAVHHGRWVRFRNNHGWQDGPVPLQKGQEVARSCSVKALSHLPQVFNSLSLLVPRDKYVISIIAQTLFGNVFIIGLGSLQVILGLCALNRVQTFFISSYTPKPSTPVSPKS